MHYDVDIRWDDEAGVWCAVCDEIPLALESNSFDALVEKAKIVAHEILEINGKLREPAQLCFRTAHPARIA